MWDITIATQVIWFRLFQIRRNLRFLCTPRDRLLLSCSLEITHKQPKYVIQRSHTKPRVWSNKTSKELLMSLEITPKKWSLKITHKQTSKELGHTQGATSKQNLVTWFHPIVCEVGQTNGNQPIMLWNAKTGRPFEQKKLGHARLCRLTKKYSNLQGAMSRLPGPNFQTHDPI